MMEDRNFIPEDVLLHDEDFPANYVNMMHPDNGKLCDNIVKEFIYHHQFNKHDRLIVRTCWKTAKNKYIPFSFICDTGVPKHLYLSQNTISKLSEYELLYSSELDISYVKIHKNPTTIFKAPIDETPNIHKNANIIGLKTLKKLGLVLDDDVFRFNNEFQHF
jgi:hypothetical protein